MFQTYAHITGGDIDREILRTYGITIDKRKGEVTNKRLEPRQCKNCYTINSTVANYCDNCGQELTEQAVATDSQIIRSVVSTPDTLQEYVNDLVDAKLKERVRET
jgi:integrase/recombinase XerD